MQEARILDSGRSEWLPGMQETRIRNDNDDDDKNSSDDDVNDATGDDD